MRLPRDLNGEELARRLERLGFERDRQEGSHIQLKHAVTGKKVTVPAHVPLKIGTLSAIVRTVGAILEIERDEVLQRLADV